MSTLDWYQRHGLGRQQRPAVVPKYTVDGSGRVLQVNAPAPMQEPQAPTRAPFGRPQGEVPLGQTSAHDAIRLWRGSREAQTAASGCPACGSPNYFSAVKASVAGRPAMGHCFDCGYRPASASGVEGPTAQPHGPVTPQAGVPIEQAREVPGMGGFHGDQLVGVAR